MSLIVMLWLVTSLFSVSFGLVVNQKCFWVYQTLRPQKLLVWKQFLNNVWKHNHAHANKCEALCTTTYMHTNRPAGSDAVVVQYDSRCTTHTHTHTLFFTVKLQGTHWPNFLPVSSPRWGPAFLSTRFPQPSPSELSPSLCLWLCVSLCPPSVGV